MTTSYAQSLTVDEIEANAYAVYKRLRAEEPVAYVPALNSWLVTKWEDVNRVTTETETFTAVGKDTPVVRHFGDPAIIHVDGDVHRELRKGIAPHYAAGRVADYIDGIVRPIARDCIAASPESGEVDLLADYFEPISALTLARTFGVMNADVNTQRRWFHGPAMGAINFGRDPERTERCDETKPEINAAFNPIFEALEAAPNDTPLSHLLYHGMPEGERRSREYVMPTIRVTLLGGMQEPGHGAANTLVGLLEHPDQMELALRILLEEFSEITLDQDKPHEFFGWEFRAPNHLYVMLKR